MKALFKYILSSALLISFSKLQAQVPITRNYHAMQLETGVPPPGTLPNFRGIWGIGENPQNDITNYASLNNPVLKWHGYHLMKKWEYYETSPGVYNFSSLAADIAFIRNTGLYIGVQINVGSACPEWLMDLVGCYATQGHPSEVGPYPRYYHPEYKKAFFRFQNALADFLSQYRDVVYWTLVEGTTGDPGPHQGTPVTSVGCGTVNPNDPYIPKGTDDTWDAFRRQDWDTCKAALARNGNTWMGLLINGGSNGENVDELFAKGYYNKNGSLSHDYAIDGEGIYVFFPPLTERGECQGYIFQSTNKEQDYYMLIISSLAYNLDIFNTPPGVYNQLPSDASNFSNAIFNDYADEIDPATSSKAFIKFAGKVSLDSTNEYPENVFGPVIKPARLSAYNNRINQIHNSDAGPTYKRWLRMQTTSSATNFNSARADAIRQWNESQGTGAIYNYGTRYNWQNDYGFSLGDNYGRWITQPNVRSTSTLSYRLGASTQPYGRYSRGMKAGIDIICDIDDRWYGGATSAKIQFTVAYWNAGNEVWSIQAHNGTSFTDVKTITNTNTNAWIETTFTVNSMRLGTNDDFEIHHISGSLSARIDIIRIKVVP